MDQPGDSPLGPHVPQQAFESLGGTTSARASTERATTTALDEVLHRLAALDARGTALVARFERLEERLDDQYDRLGSIDYRLASADARVSALDGQFAVALTPLADEVRAQPGRGDIEDMIGKVVQAAHDDIVTRLSALEDTVQALAGALQRPAPGLAADGQAHELHT